MWTPVQYNCTCGAPLMLKMLRPHERALWCVHCLYQNDRRSVKGTFICSTHLSNSYYCAVWPYGTAMDPLKN